MRKHERKNVQWYGDFINLKREYDRVNREDLWHVLRMYDVGGKLLGGIKSMHVDSVAYIRVKGDETETFG